MIYWHFINGFSFCLILAIISGSNTQWQILNLEPPFLNNANTALESLLVSPKSTTTATSQSTQSVESSQFCSKCYGRSICLISGEKPKCFCPPDHYGQFCDQSIHKLHECNKNECENGGICKQGHGETFCVCPLTYVGKNCSRVGLWIQVEMNLFAKGLPTNSNYVDKMETGTSDAVCKKLLTSALSGPDPVLKTTITDCNLKHFESTKIGGIEGVRVRALLKFDSGYNKTSFGAANVRNHLEMAPDFPGSIGADFIIARTIVVTNFDICKSDMHDCSPSAACSSDGHSYMCRCNRFYTDGGDLVKKLPGRVCYLNHTYGALIATLTLTPFVVCSVMLFFWVRKKAFLRFWVLPTSEYSDKGDLAELPKHAYSV